MPLMEPPILMPFVSFYAIAPPRCDRWEECAQPMPYSSWPHRRGGEALPPLLHVSRCASALLAMPWAIFAISEEFHRDMNSSARDDAHTGADASWR